MEYKKSDYFSFIVAYTIKNEELATAFKSFLTSGYEEKGLNARMIDQSTYGTRARYSIEEVCTKIQSEVKKISVNHKTKYDPKDFVKIFCSAVKAEDDINGRFIFQYKIKMT